MSSLPLAGNENFFRTFWPRVAASVTSHRAGRTAVEDVRSLIRLLRLRRGARILDVPCGYGRHAVELARRRFDVTGVDISPALLAQARQAAAAAGVRAEFRRGDMRRLAYRRRFDAVLNLFTSFGYFGDAGDLRVLRNFHSALRPDGWLVLHLINRDWLVRHYQPYARSRMSEFVVTERSRLDLATSLVITDWTVERGRRVWRNRSRLRVYSCHELLGMLKEVGFRDTRCLGDLRGKPLTLDSRWQVLLARR
ncbi:MAG: class I SAM-dependent methyltransferase [Acidobacteria bacterium]|nr:class I SAM-dependent methyltransferase [Acidobacteriota bacterium]